MARRSIVVSAVFASFIGAAATPALAGQGVFRCEDGKGRVTYSDEPCPSSARSIRRIDDTPPVRVNEDAAPKAVTRLSAPVINLQAVQTTAFDPDAEFRRLDEDRVRQQRECQRLNQRIAYASNDLATASESQRASAELALRRLQEEQRAVCPRS